jgi:rfaE bifunctional protein kinase chain/domain
MKSKMSILSSEALKKVFTPETAKTILVFGDLILDSHLKGDVQRISPEAPVPVLSNPSKEVFMIGGAGNTAHNFVSLGNKVNLVGAIGEAVQGALDQSGEILCKLLRSANISTDYLLPLNRHTTKKQRILANNQQILRIDTEDTKSLNTEEENICIEILKKALENIDGIIVSDYAKGMITAKTIAFLEEFALNNNIPILIDTKLQNIQFFKRPTLIKPNLKEAQEFTGLTFTGKIEEVAEMAEKLYQKFSSNVLITCGKLGMLTYDGKEAVSILAKEQEVFDVSGAGDTVIAATMHGLLKGLSLVDSAIFATNASSLAIKKKGTVAVSITELKAELEKIIMPKTWGHEEWIVNSEYCGKKLVLNEGYCCSLHYHKIKDETFYIAKGKVGFQLNDEHFILNPGDSLLITPGTKHRFYGLENSEIFEFSTHHLEEDSYRDEESGTFEKSLFSNARNYNG